MRFEETHAASEWRKFITPYRLLRDPNHFGFVIEAAGRMPEQPRLWLENRDAIIHHSRGLFVVLKNLPDDLLGEIASRDLLLISETYGRAYGDGLMPWGMDKSGNGGRTYEAEIIHTEHIGDIRKIFNGARDSEVPDGTA